MIKGLVAAAAALAVLAICGGCVVPDDRGRQAVESAGFSGVQLGEAAILSCSDSDEYIGRHFAATNAAGKPVRGVVCCGLWKSCTVRF